MYINKPKQEEKIEQEKVIEKIESLDTSLRNLLQLNEQKTIEIQKPKNLEKEEEKEFKSCSYYLSDENLQKIVSALESLEYYKTSLLQITDTLPYHSEIFKAGLKFMLIEFDNNVFSLKQTNRYYGTSTISINKIINKINNIIGNESAKQEMEENSWICDAMGHGFHNSKVGYIIQNHLTKTFIRNFDKIYPIIETMLNDFYKEEIDKLNKDINLEERDDYE